MKQDTSAQRVAQRYLDVRLAEVMTLPEAIFTPEDKKVFIAFLTKKRAESERFSTNGKILKSLWPHKPGGYFEAKWQDANDFSILNWSLSDDMEDLLNGFLGRNNPYPYSISKGWFDHMVLEGGQILLNPKYADKAPRQIERFITLGTQGIFQYPNARIKEIANAILDVNHGVPVNIRAILRGPHRPMTASQRQAHSQVQLETLLEGVTRQAVKLTGMEDLVNDLIRAGEYRRLGRITPIKPTEVRFDGQRIMAVVKGETGVYQTHITLPPKRGHHCTCPDWVQNGTKVGPCKHVLALGIFWRDERVLPALENLENGLVSILEHGNL